MAFIKTVGNNADQDLLIIYIQPKLELIIVT